MQNISKKWAYNFSTDARAADGKYQFIQHYGTSDNLSEILTRENGDIQSIRSEVNIRYRLREKETLP